MGKILDFNITNCTSWRVIGVYIIISIENIMFSVAFVCLSFCFC